ncbi:ELAV-like protein 1 [Convolutriloba macropyga]|uniref:ELAV-like protein 1 n=1 Tax=Convolutriloba macropyga TaxID=536237 RepID=UPI003F51C7F2
MALSKTNILVNQLPKSMGDAQFREVFESIGELKSCQVIKDRNTRESLCYGFVEFVKEEDAQKAMEELNNYQVEDKYLKLQFARRNNFQAKKGGTRIFVSKLPSEVTEEKLQELFGEFGEVNEVQLPLKNDGTAKGYAFLTYQEEMDAKASIEALNEYTDDFFSQPLSVKISVSDLSIQAEKKKALKQVTMTNGSSLHSTTTPSAFGMGMDPTIQSQFIGGHHLGGFQQHHAHSNNGFMQQQHEDMIDPSMIPPPPPKRRKETTEADIDFMPRKPEKVVLPDIPPNSDGVTLFFYNIGKDTDESQMKQVLLNQGVGAMLYISIVRDPSTSLSKNFAFVKFKNQEDAQQTIALLHRSDLFGCGPCEIKFKTFTPTGTAPNGKSSGNRDYAMAPDKHFRSGYYKSDGVAVNIDD